MSEQTPESFNVPADPTSALSALLGFLAPEEDAAPAAAGAAPDGGTTGGAGQQPPAAEGTGTAATDAAAPPAGDGKQPQVPNGEAGSSGTGADGAGSAAGAETGVAPEVYTKHFGEVATAFETKQSEILKQEALKTVRADYEKYFDAVQKHPRSLVGVEVPSITGSGMEKLRDTNDARDWQEATKQLLFEEVTARAGKAQEDLRDVFTTVHSTIDLFRNNLDLVPGAKGFDKELADAFVAAAKDYEVKSGDKHIGYSVPVQPIINALRSQISSRRGAAAVVPPVAAAPPAERTPDGRYTGPQAGLRSSAGQSATGGDEGAGVLSAFYRQNGLSL